ncbi:hypothetical protein OCA5_c21050 [Afipia carboxidovorans OM5]|uniref:Uncharacterized protein n=1 Tax=Afipia carboxidovorans (strain ATCC 49405 / DSM 1227 / KCTC 32145 / OM5) TaxID=504832 RepID=F8BWP3_AFIC5|nr:hypothetical protein OCA4_c21040 [Afipia carboxidovorans OM4]AEI06811.1 hypothetical protein OCA5_c21050 [Afipia carboxidovorans OM5]
MYALASHLALSWIVLLTARSQVLLNILAADTPRHAASLWSIFCLSLNLDRGRTNFTLWSIC